MSLCFFGRGYISRGQSISPKFAKVIYENVEEKKTFISQQTYLYIEVTEILKFYEVLFRAYCKGLLSCLEKTLIMFIFLCICIKHFRH